MKIYKFRAWDESEKDMIYCGLEFVSNYWNKYFLEWMQFTGILDKNGKEIYESDLISYGVGNLEVIYQDGAFGYKNIEGDFCLLSNHNKDLEVVGNVYEHSILLNKII